MRRCRAKLIAEAEGPLERGDGPAGMPPAAGPAFPPQGARRAGGARSVAAQGGRSDGFLPVPGASRGPADEPAAYREWSGRAHWVAPIEGVTEVQASLDGFHDWRTRGTDFTVNRTNGADASLRLVSRGAWQWSALAYWQWR